MKKTSTYPRYWRDMVDNNLESINYALGSHGITPETEEDAKALYLWLSYMAERGEDL